MVRRFYSDTFRVNFRGLVVFVVEFAPSFCCVPDPPRRNVVFACGYVAPFVSLKSSNFVLLLNFVVFALFFCFVFLFFSRFFLFSFFSVFACLCFRFFRNSFWSNVTSLFFGRPLLFRLFFRFLSCDSIFVFCFVSRYSAITVFSSGALSRLVRGERMAAPPTRSQDHISTTLP